MGAKNNSTGGNKNFYGIAFGYLSTKVKDLPIEKEETTTATLKAKMQKFENLDLRNAYVKKDGEFPYQVFYQSITGEILSIDRETVEGIGILLKINILDEDLENSSISVKFYSKYTENFLNRLINLTGNNVTISPYSIPSEWEGKRYYNQGVVIYEGVEKVVPSLKGEELLPTEQITKEDGTTGYSRVKRIDDLWDRAGKKINSFKPTPTSTIEDVHTEDDDDLPF